MTDLSEEIRIVTHNGKIHSDEVASIALLTSYFSNQGKQVSVLRTRDLDKTSPDDILVDIGLKYNHEFFQYDHHQEDFNETWNHNNISLSSAGLIWRHYGEEIIELYLSNHVDQYDHGFNYTEETIQEIKDIIYDKLIKEIDANENGIQIESDLNISELIAALNGDINDEYSQNLNFNRAVGLVGTIFDIKFNEIINTYFNFQKDFDMVKDMDLSGPYLVVKENIPTIFKCISVLDPECKIKFCIFVNNSEYTIKTRRENGNKFSPLCPILSEDILKNSCKSDDIIFIHKAGFLAKTKTLETAKIVINLSLLNMINFNTNDLQEPDVYKRDVLKNNKNMLLGGGIAVAGLAGLGLLYWNTNDN